MGVASPLASAGCPYTARRQFARLTRSGRWGKTLARTRANRPPTANIPVVPAPAQLNKRVPFPTAIAWEAVSSSRGGLPTESDHGQHPMSDMPGPRLRSHLHSPARRNHPTNRSTSIRRNPLRSRHRRDRHSPVPGQLPPRSRLPIRPHKDPTGFGEHHQNLTAGTVDGPAPGAEDEPEQQKSVRCPATHHRTSGIRPRACCRGLAGPSANARRASSQKGRSPARFMSPVMPARQFASTGSSRFDCRVGPIPMDGAGMAHRARDDGDEMTKREVRRISWRNGFTDPVKMPSSVSSSG